MSAGSLENCLTSYVLLVFAPAGALCFVFLVEGWRQSVLRRIRRLEKKTDIHESWMTAILRSFFEKSKDSDSEK